VPALSLLRVPQVPGPARSSPRADHTMYRGAYVQTDYIFRAV
jgi:hypothetical protein